MTPHIQLKKAAAIAERQGWELDYYDDTHILVSVGGLKQRHLASSFFKLSQSITSDCAEYVRCEMLNNENYTCVVRVYIDTVVREGVSNKNNKIPKNT